MTAESLKDYVIRKAKYLAIMREIWESERDTKDLARPRCTVCGGLPYDIGPHADYREKHTHTSKNRFCFGKGKPDDSREG